MSKWEKKNGKCCAGSYHKFLIRFSRAEKKYLVAISIGIPITITNTNHKLTTSMKATKATNSRGKSATELEEVKEKKETQIFSK